jgi:hypothetical protein
MESIGSFVKDKWSGHPTVTSVLAVTTQSRFTPLVDGFDVLLLVVTTDEKFNQYTTHYIKDNTSIQERWVTSDGLDRWVVAGENRSIIQWILQGQIWIDHEGYLEKMKHNLLLFPIEMREQKLFIEFSLFLKTYLQSKHYLKEGHLLDAYSNILEALVHWARIAIIESGIHPEVTLWKQLEQINPGIYKLMEELAETSETLEQRVQLVLLACEFHVMSKMQDCCTLLIKVLRSRKEPFSPYELMQHSLLQPLHTDLATVLKKLVKRGLIQEAYIINEQEGELGAIELQYTAHLN